MSNINNSFNLIGRTTREIQVYDNKDGSRKVLMTIAVQNNFKSRDGERKSQFINVEALIPAMQNGLGIYAYIHKGDLIAVGGSIRSSVYQKDGQPVFKQILNVEDVTLLEPKSITNARANSAQLESETPTATSDKFSDIADDQIEDPRFGSGSLPFDD